MEHKYNLIDERWIPTVPCGKVSLRDLFTDTTITSFAGNPIQKISLFKFCLAICQSAITPHDVEQWKSLGFRGLSPNVLDYLESQHDKFWLYGDEPFLQFPQLQGKTKKCVIQQLVPSFALGNTSGLFDNQKIFRCFRDDEKALTLITVVTGFAYGGKKTDNSVVLTPGYLGKTNDKGNPSSGAKGCSLGPFGYLHAFCMGKTLQESFWINLLTEEDLSHFPQFTHGVGLAPWAQMPKGEQDSIAIALQDSYIGTLITLDRFILLYPNTDECEYTEGIPFSSHYGLSLSINDRRADKVSFIWTDPQKRPWRQLPSMLSFFSETQTGEGFTNRMLEKGFEKSQQYEGFKEINIYAGGVSVSSNAGEQYASGFDNFVESSFLLDTGEIGGSWYGHLVEEMNVLDSMNKSLYGAVFQYFKNVSNGDEKMAKPIASSVCTKFWQQAEFFLSQLIEACDQSLQNRIELRKLYWNIVITQYKQACPMVTGRQFEVFAKCFPKGNKFFEGGETK